MLEKENPSDQIARICDRTKHELLAVLLSLSTESKVDTTALSPKWMTAAQLAEYWQFVDEHGKPRTAGILKWTKRTPDNFPLPHAYMGDLLRFHRETVDKWAAEETMRHEAKRNGKRLKIA